MNPWMSQQLAEARIADMHRAAAMYQAYRRLPRRADRAPRRLSHRLAAAFRVTAFRRGPAVVGCQA